MGLWKENIFWGIELFLEIYFVYITWLVSFGKVVSCLVLRLAWAFLEMNGLVRITSSYLVESNDQRPPILHRPPTQYSLCLLSHYFPKSQSRF